MNWYDWSLVAGASGYTAALISMTVFNLTHTHKHAHPDCTPRLQSCAACGCLIADGREKAVERQFNSGDSYYCSPVLYCAVCAPPYEQVVEDGGNNTRYFVTEAARRVEVDVDGEAVPVKKGRAK